VRRLKITEPRAYPGARRVLRPADLLRTAGLGVTSRPQRTALSALGVALGIASLVALTWAAASNQAELLRQLDEQGADLAVVSPTLGPDNQPIPVHDAAPEMIARVHGVAQIGVLEHPPEGLGVFRNELVPPQETNGLTVAVARPNLFDAVGAELAHGRWFDDATRALPTVVLGATAAERLGIAAAGEQVWIGGRWYGVIGILESSGLAGGGLNTAAILGDRWVRAAYGDPAAPAGEDPIGHVAQIFVRAEPGRIGEVSSALAAAASPGAPHQVDVAGLLDLAAARATADDALATLGLVLAGIALLVGGVGIANTMVVTVMERRGEIGLRRALGARPGQVATQFVAEAVALSLLGGLTGAALGTAAAVVIAFANQQPVAVPLPALVAGPVVAVVVGAVAGLHPAMRAARTPPTQALKGV